MLHALLHRKLDETIPEPQRFEDALTSTVFGTLVVVEAADMLAAWLSHARRIDGSRARVDGPLNGVWFWPRLALAEPDVIIQLGDRLFVIEAKFQSGRHDQQRCMEDPGHIADQLQRQWVSLDVDHAGRARCDRDLREVIESCAHTLVYVVDGRRLRRATREFTESAGRLPAGADLRLLTWQTLHEHLARQSPDRCRWRDLLSQYLRDRGLHGFDGFANQRAKQPFDPRMLAEWCRLVGSHAALHLRRAVGVSQESQEVLSGWRPDYAAGSHQTWSSDWIKRSAVPTHSFLLAASWTLADSSGVGDGVQLRRALGAIDSTRLQALGEFSIGSRTSEIRLLRSMDLFSAERASGLRRAVMKFTIDEKGD